MAESNLAQASIDAMYQNPALLPADAFSPRLSLFGDLAQGRSLYSLAGVIALQEDFRLGIAWQSASDIRLHAMQEDTLSLAAAFEIGPAFSLGARFNLRQLNSPKLSENIRGANVDLGVARELLQVPGLPGTFSFALHADNAAGSWPEYWGDMAPLNIALGALYLPLPSLMLSARRDWKESDSGVFSMGAEWKAWERLKLRSGWKAGTRPRFSAGLGSSISWMNAHIDYALSWHPEEVLGHCVSIEMGLPGLRGSFKASPRQLLRDPENGEIQNVLFQASIDSSLKAKAWHIEIKDMQGRLLRKLENADPSLLEISWDGKDSQKAQIPADTELRFILVLETKDGNILKSTEQSLDRFLKKEALAMRAKKSSDAKSSRHIPKLRPIFAEEGASKLSMVILEMPEISEDVARWSVDFKNRQQTLLRHLQGEGAMPKEVVWDGKNERGELVDDPLGVQVYTVIEDNSGNKLEEALPLFTQAAYEIAFKELKDRPELALAALGMNFKLQRPALLSADASVQTMTDEALERHARWQARLNAPEGSASHDPRSEDKAWFFDLFEDGGSQILPSREARLKPLLKMLEGRRDLTLVVSGASLATEKGGRALAMRRALALVMRLQDYGGLGVQVELQSPLESTDNRGVRIEIR